MASFDGPSAFLATLLILYFCCVLIQVLLLSGKQTLSLTLSLSLSLSLSIALLSARLSGNLATCGWSPYRLSYIIPNCTHVKPCQYWSPGHNKLQAQQTAVTVWHVGYITCFSWSCYLRVSIAKDPPGTWLAMIDDSHSHNRTTRNIFCHVALRNVRPMHTVPHKTNDPKLQKFLQHTLFCSSAVLDPRVGHTMDVHVLSQFIPVLCHSVYFICHSVFYMKNILIF